MIPAGTLGLTTYYVTETVGACAGPASAVTVTINSLPASPTVGANVTYCLGESLAPLTALGSGGTLNWYDDAGLTNLVGTGGSLTPSAALGATTYYVTETVGTCTGPAATVTSTVGTAPVITINSIIGLDCFGDTDGYVDISISGGQSPYNYDWSIDGTGDTDDPQDLTNGVVGVFSVAVIDNNGCTDFTTGVISGPPNLVLTATTTDESISGNGAIDLTVNGGSGPFTYSWSNGASSEDPTSLSSGSYNVIVTDANGCTATLTVFVGSVVGINEVAIEMGLMIYPNPTDGIFNVEFSNYSGDVQFEIVDLAGKIVYKDVKNVNIGEPINFNIQNVESGVYFLRLENEFDKASIRIIKK